jgi:hypothetical protein
MSNMEKFIHGNREEFDHLEPSEKIWEQIESGMNKKNRPARVVSMPILKWSVAAAVVLALGLTSIYILNRNVGNNVEGGITKVTPSMKDPVVEQIDPQYGQMVAQFSALIESKQKELRSLEKDNPSLYAQFSTDIKRLDSTYQVLRSTLTANPNKEQLLQAMISNLQMQIDLLNQQLSIIKKVKHPVKEKI